MFECSFLALCHLTCWSVLLLVALFCIFYEVCWGCFSFVLNNLSPSLLYWTRIYEGVSKSYRTEAITKHMLTTINTKWEATQRVMAAKLTRLTLKIAIQVHLVAESCTTCSSRSRRPVRNFWIHPLINLTSLGRHRKPNNLERTGQTSCVHRWATRTAGEGMNCCCIWPAVE